MLTPACGPSRSEDLVRRFMAGDPTAGGDAVDAAPTSEDPALLVVASLVSGRRSHLGRASAQARTARDRQLVALADAYLRGDAALFEVLVREHLAQYPDDSLAAWLASEPT